MKYQMKRSLMQTKFPTGDNSWALRIFQDDISRFRVTVKIKLGRDSNIAFSFGISAHNIKLFEIRSELTVKTHCHRYVSQWTESTECNLAYKSIDMVKIKYQH